MRKAVIIIVILLALILAAIFVYCEFINKENKKNLMKLKVIVKRKMMEVKMR